MKGGDIQEIALTMNHNPNQACQPMVINSRDHHLRTVVPNQPPKIAWHGYIEL
jgi:hypothetical protein